MKARKQGREAVEFVMTGKLPKGEGAIIHLCLTPLRKFCAIQDLMLIVSIKTRRRCLAQGFEEMLLDGIENGRIGIGRLA